LQVKQLVEVEPVHVAHEVSQAKQDELERKYPTAQVRQLAESAAVHVAQEASQAMQLDEERK